ncbi:YhgE/Pip domain-containing protein [Phocicoccus pinnipedialis]|nr:YhgE/Pip domain-containing protein [Jeotgalicoccus pinnipedialis]
MIIKKGEHMFQDFKFILKKPLLLVSLLFVATLPVIYAVTFLGAMWNPYERTSEMTFSIVNEDTGGNEINLGEDFIDEIKKHDDLKWEFTDLGTAENHLQSGESYGYIRIPKDASKNAESFLTEEPKQINLDLKTNPGHNFIGSIMSQQAGSTIVTQVSNTITKTYTETMFTSLKELKENSKEGADALKNLEKGMNDLNNGLIELNESASTLAQGETQFTNQLTSLSPMLGDYAQQVIAFQGQLERGADEVAGGTNQLTEGSANLQQGISELNKEMGKSINKVDNVSFTDSGAEYLASPIHLNVESTVHTQNYAQSFAPLIIGISLFIGSVTFNVVYPMNKIFETTVRPLKQWTSRVLLTLSHALIISTLLFIALVSAMNIEVASQGKFFLALFLWAAASIAAITALVMIFGNLGKFIGLLLLIVQLSSSAGTFPIETSNKFYETMHSILPMAYVITGLRDAIFGQTFDIPFSTIMYVLTSFIVVSHIVIYIVFFIKSLFPSYKEFTQKVSRFEN